RNCDRNNTVELRVAGLPHTSKSADSQLLDELEMTQSPHRCLMRRARGLVINQAETAAATRTGNFMQGIEVDHFDRIVAMRAANLETLAGNLVGGYRLAGGT